MRAFRLNRARTILGTLALAFAVLVGGTTLATATNPTVSDCETQWEHSEAYRNCNASSITVSGSNCDLSGSCSIDVRMYASDGTSTSHTFTPSMDIETALTRVEDLDICFGRNAAGTWNATVKTACLYSETNSTSAIKSGLTKD